MKTWASLVFSCCLYLCPTLVTTKDAEYKAMVLTVDSPITNQAITFLLLTFFAREFIVNYEKPGWFVVDSQFARTTDVIVVLTISLAPFISHYWGYELGHVVLLFVALIRFSRSLGLEQLYLGASGW